eukprot:2934416-Lingulodinium_polyedra.AAC.1
MPTLADCGARVARWASVFLPSPPQGGVVSARRQRPRRRGRGGGLSTICYSCRLCCALIVVTGCA